MHRFHKKLALLLVWYGICWKRQYPLTLQPPEACKQETEISIAWQLICFKRQIECTKVNISFDITKEAWQKKTIDHFSQSVHNFHIECKLRYLRHFWWPNRDSGKLWGGFLGHYIWFFWLGNLLVTWQEPWYLAICFQCCDNLLDSHLKALGFSRPFTRHTLTLAWP